MIDIRSEEDTVDVNKLEHNRDFRIEDSSINVEGAQWKRFFKYAFSFFVLKKLIKGSGGEVKG